MIVDIDEDLMLPAPQIVYHPPQLQEFMVLPFENFVPGIARAILDAEGFTLPAGYRLDSGGDAAPPAAQADPIHSLSPREHEILGHIARGASNKEIARALDIAETTVKIHVQHILRKLKLSSRVQAAVYATVRTG